MTPDELEGMLSEGQEPQEQGLEDWLEQELSTPAPTAYGEFNASRMAGQATIIDGVEHFKEEATRKVFTQDLLGELHTSVSKFYDAKREELKQDMDSQLGSPDFDVNTFLPQSQARYQLIESTRSSPLAHETAYVTSAAPDAKPDRAKEAVFQAKAINWSIEMGEKMGWAGTMSDFLGNIPEVVGYQIFNIDDAVRDNPELRAIHGASLEETIFNWQALDPATKEVLLPKLQETFRKVAPDAMSRVTGMLSAAGLDVAEIWDEERMSGVAVDLMTQFITAPDASHRFDMRQLENAAWTAVDVAPFAPKGSTLRGLGARLRTKVAPAEEIAAEAVLRSEGEAAAAGAQPAPAREIPLGGAPQPLTKTSIKDTVEYGGEQLTPEQFAAREMELEALLDKKMPIATQKRLEAEKGRWVDEKRELEAATARDEHEPIRGKSRKDAVRIANKERAERIVELDARISGIDDKLAYSRQGYEAEAELSRLRQAKQAQPPREITTELRPSQAAVAIRAAIENARSVQELATAIQLTSAERLAVNAVLKEVAEDAVARGSVPHTAAAAGDLKAAAGHAAKAAADPEVAKAMGTNQTNAALAADPYQPGGWFKEVVPELSPEMAKVLNADAARAAGYVEDMISGTTGLRIGVLSNPVERQAISERLLDKVRQKLDKDLLSSGMVVDNLRIAGSDASGFTYEYTVRRADSTLSSRQAASALDTTVPTMAEMKVVADLADAGQGSLRKTMEATAKDARVPTKYRILAKKIARQLEKMEALGIEAKLRPSNAGELGGNTLGRTDAKPSNIVFNEAGKIEVILRTPTSETGPSGFSLQTLMHESVHAATMATVHYGNMYAAAGTAIRQQVKDLYAITDEAIKVFNKRVADAAGNVKGGLIDESKLTKFELQTYDKMNNAFHDPDEILAWGLTNPDMQSWMRSQKSILGKRSIWDSFVYALGKLLGLGGSKELTLLDDLLSTGSKLLSADPSEVRAVSEAVGQRFMESGTDVVKTGTLKFTLNEVTGTYEATVEALAKRGTASTHVLSPSTWSIGGTTSDFGRAVREEMVEVDAGAAYEKQALEMHKWAMAPISGIKQAAARKRVSAVLDALDEYINPDTYVVGKVATPTELAAGVNTSIGKVRLTEPNEVAAYYRLRQLADAEWELMNYAQRRTYELGGFKEVVMANGTKQVAKPYESAQAARMALSNKEGYAVFDDFQRTTDVWTEEELVKRYEEGYKLARLRKQYNTSGGRFDSTGERVEYMWVKDANVRELPSHVLNYKPGYVPRINKAEFMLVLSNKVPMKGNLAAEETSAMRGFNSRLDAEIFRAELVAKDLGLSAKGVLLDGKGGFVFPEDRVVFVDKTGKNPIAKSDLQAMIDARLQAYRINGAANYSLTELLEDAVESSGGLYTGERSRERLLFGLSGQEMERIPAMEAYERQSSHVGRLISRNEMRLAREKKWLNTVRKTFPEVRLQGFDNTALPPGPKGQALERLRQQIREWNGIPSHPENLMQAAIQYTHDWVLHAAEKFGAGNLGITDFAGTMLLNLKHSNPANAIKAANMHVLLGFLNPKQWMVQGANAVTALSRHFDVHLAGSNMDDVMLAFKWAMLDNIKNPDALGRAVAMIRKEWGLSKEMEEAYLAWRRSGLHDSVMQNADLAKVSTDGLGVTMEVMSKAENISMMLYNSGELFNRRFSFIKGYASQMQKVKAAGRKFTDDDLFEAIADSQKSMWEMNRANRASWQGGSGTSLTRQLAGIYSQFAAVAIKPWEMAIRSEVTRGGLTAKELQRVIFGQLMFFGFAGLPMGALLVNAIKTVTGATDMPDEVVTALNQGIVGSLTNTILGADLDISRNLSVMGQFTDTVRDMMRSGDPMIYAWLGVGGTTGVRILDAVQELRHLWLGAGDMPVGDRLRACAPIIGSVLSSTSNATKGYFMHKYHKLYRRDLVTTVAADDFSVMEEIFVGLGFRPLIEDTVYAVSQSSRRRQELVKEIGDARIRLKQRMLMTGSDPAAVQILQDADAALSNMVSDDPELLHNLIRYMDSRIYDNPTTLEEKALNQHFKDHMSSVEPSSSLLQDNTSAVGIVKLDGSNE